jgi:hypothetical protein
MDEHELASVAHLLMCKIEAMLDAKSLPENAQLIVRPLHTWPDGEPALWIMVNCPN